VYTRDDPNSAIVDITRSGTATAWIRYRAYPGHKPKLKARNWVAIGVSGAAYIWVDGFEIEGNRAELTYDYAYAERNNQSNPITSGNGIAVAQKYQGNPPQYSHHVKVINNIVRDCPGGGIYTYNADYVTIEGNTVYNNGFFSPYGNSGISMYQNWNSDGNNGYKMFVRRNIVYGNENFIPFFAVGAISDGNGIIIDDSRNTQNGSVLGAYRGRTRVENNVTYDNGGRGIHVFESDRVDIVNNTTYRNSRSPSIEDGEITTISASDVRAWNNVIYATDGKPANKIYAATGIVFDYNLVFNSDDFTSGEAHNTIGVDPGFVAASSGDFKLRPDSPGIDRGGTALAAKRDIRGVRRPQGNGVDIGAYERRPDE
jgi:parallel beta-helix repeat protein